MQRGDAWAAGMSPCLMDSYSVAGFMRRNAAASLTVRMERIRALLVAWYRTRAEAWLPPRAQLWAERMGMTVPTVLVREQELRWGSCSPSGVVRFNCRVIQVSARLVDYVVAHEVLHLRHPDTRRRSGRRSARCCPTSIKASRSQGLWGASRLVGRPRVVSRNSKINWQSQRDSVKRC